MSLSFSVIVKKSLRPSEVNSDLPDGLEGSPKRAIDFGEPPEMEMDQKLERQSALYPL